MALTKKPKTDIDPAAMLIIEKSKNGYTFALGKCWTPIIIAFIVVCYGQQTLLPAVISALRYVMK